MAYGICHFNKIFYFRNLDIVASFNGVVDKFVLPQIFWHFERILLYLKHGMHDLIISFGICSRNLFDFDVIFYFKCKQVLKTLLILIHIALDSQ